MSLSVLPMFSSKSFMVSGLIFRSLIHLNLSLYMVLGSILIHSFTCSCPVFSAPFIEEAVFAPLYILASFVKNKVPIGVCVYFWAFCLAPLVYISVFVPGPYCLDDCSFDSSSSILLSQYCFGYPGSFVFPYE